MKLIHKVGLGVGAVTIVAFATRATSNAPSAVSPAPLVLEKVQALGQLHTARYTYQNVFEHSTSLDPAEWASYVPGATSFVRASTQNTALVEVHGDVEAGVDLSKARLERPVGQNPRLVLPHAIVYRPNVDTVVHDVRRGYFWRDDNIAIDAEKAAGSRFREAAKVQGIVEQAEKNVLPELAKIVPPHTDVKFE